jgi:hypothetical protein
LSASVRETLLAVPAPLLVGLNSLRILPGGFMVLLALQGKLSGPFPQSAGWGDVIVGLTAIPLMVAAARDFAANRGAVLIWNIAGSLDLAAAVALGVMSAPASPLRSSADRPVLRRYGRCRGRTSRRYWCRSTSSPTASSSPNWRGPELRF